MGAGENLTAQACSRYHQDSVLNGAQRSLAGSLDLESKAPSTGLAMHSLQSGFALGGSDHPSDSRLSQGCGILEAEELLL